MPDAAHPVRSHAATGFAGRVVVGFVRRGYALVLIAIIVWLTFLAVRYLIRSLIQSPPPPPQVVQLPTRLNADVLRTWREAWPGIGAAQHARTPLSHYHRIDGWIQPDEYNDCTRSGCHRPLPHTQRKEVRAFLNMHATSIHCGVCHMRSDASPLSLTWYDLHSGRPRSAPALFEAYGLAMRPWTAPPGPQEQAELVRLLREAGKELDGDPVFGQLAEQVQAVRAGSPAIQGALAAVQAALSQHFRGEYGAKLALREGQTGRPVLAQPGTASAVRDYLARGAALSGAERTALLAQIHPWQRERALHCTDCHRQTGSLIDFGTSGYPPSRREALFRPLIFQMIEHIAAGQPMHLPQFITPGGPTSRAEPPPGATRP